MSTSTRRKRAWSPTRRSGRASSLTRRTSARKGPPIAELRLKLPPGIDAAAFRVRVLAKVKEEVPAPPEIWATPYAAIAREDELRWTTLGQAFEAARAFLAPILRDVVAMRSILAMINILAMREHGVKLAPWTGVRQAGRYTP